MYNLFYVLKIDVFIVNALKLNLMSSLWILLR